MERWSDGAPLPSKLLHPPAEPAAVNGIEYLLTWNCKHIANPSARPHIERICREMGFDPAVICTPQELLEIDDRI